MMILLCSVNWGIYRPEQALLDDVKSAIVAYKANPGSAETRFELAMALAASGQIESAWSVLKTIIEYDDDYAKKVIFKYEALSKKEPKNWKHPFKLGFGYYFDNRKIQAYEEFNKVLEINPKMVWAYGFQGLLLGDQKRFREALDRCKQALKIEPDAMAIHFLMAEGYYRVGDYWNAFLRVMRVGQLKTLEKKKDVYKGSELDRELIKSIEKKITKPSKENQDVKEKEEVEQDEKPIENRDLKKNEEVEQDGHPIENQDVKKNEEIKLDKESETENDLNKDQDSKENNDMNEEIIQRKITS